MQNSFYYGLIVLVTVGIVALKIKRNKNVDRLTNYRDRQKQRISEDRIIIAIEPIDLFVNVSKRRKDRYIELQIERAGVMKYLAYVLRLFGRGMVYYKLKEQQKKNNIAFLDSLLQTNRVQLVLYTALGKEVAHSLLKRLDLARYFTPELCRFCSHSADDLKHPTEIDSITKRVIILTGLASDHTEQDSQYFLTVKKKGLKVVGKALIELITANRSLDELHNEFVNWKIDLESDYDSTHEKSQ